MAILETKYKTVTKQDVFGMICMKYRNTRVPVFPKYIAKALDTSKYQTEKQLKILLEDGVISIKTLPINQSEKLYANAYIVTKKGMKTYIWMEAKIL